MIICGVTAISAVLAAVICGVTGSFANLSWLWALPVSFLGSFLGLLVLVFLFVWIACAFINLNKPQEKDSRFYRSLAYLVVDAVLTILQVRVHTAGLEQIPQEGRFMLVCNHLEILDPLVILHYFKKSQLAFIAKREVSDMFIVGKLMHKILCQPINRENDREALKTILKCVRLIKEDIASVGVFPEGYTSLDFKLHPFRNGVFKIAQKAEVPIVVCTLQNTQNIFANAKRLRPTHVEFHLLGVIPAGELKGATATQVGNRVHAMMAEDLGPENVRQDG